VRVAKPNFSFKKRQREQAKAAKKQEKMARRAERANDPNAAPEIPDFDFDAPAADATPPVDAPSEPPTQP
jgi:hypothetical protein